MRLQAPQLRPARPSPTFRVLVAHNHHVDRGGSEVLFGSVVDLLASRGHDVATFERDSREISGVTGKVQVMRDAIWCDRAATDLGRLIELHRPQILHVINLWPMMSPSILAEAARRGVGVVMTLGDYKLTCPAGQHLRHGKICTRCLGGREAWCVAGACKGPVQSLGYALRNYVTRTREAFGPIDCFHCVSRFVADHHVAGGLPVSKMRVVPLFTSLAPAARVGRGEYVAFVGRVSPEKGLDVLRRAASTIRADVKVAGDASLHPHLVVGGPQNLSCVGPVARADLPAFLARARCLVVPSVWYECFGLVAAEAMAAGVPVIASAIGGLPEVVPDGVGGLLVPPGDAAALARAVNRIVSDDALHDRLSAGAAAVAGSRYTPDVFHAGLTAVYADAVRQEAGVE